MKVPENNSLKAVIGEILELCRKAEKEHGEKASYFNEPASEQEMTEWETENGVKIPESYKEWLRFTGKCRIVNNAATFYGPKEFRTEYVPEDLIVIGEMVGDGEVVCFSKSTGEFVRFFEGEENESYKYFNEVLEAIMETLDAGRGLSDATKILFMNMIMENRKRGDKEQEN